MPKLRVFSGGDMCKLLRAHGFQQVRSKGDHIIMQRQIGDNDTITVPVPLHRELKIGTLKSIIRQSQLDRELFETD